MVPDKIFLREFKEGGLSQVWSGIKPTEETIIASPEYIRKDALLEWVNDNLLECKASNDDADYGRIDAYKKLIDKINSL